MVEYNGSLPTFVLNPYSWTKVASVIFVDSPVGTGFLYSRTLQRWLLSHTRFIANPLYIASDSYSGVVVPIIVQKISEGTDKHIFLNTSIASLDYKSHLVTMLQGYLLGNPATDKKFDVNSRVPFAHCMAIIPDELHESAKRSCNGEYVGVDSSNIQCANDLQAISNGTIRWWIRCNTDLPYKRDVKSTVSYHFYLNRKGYRALIYSGDHDMIIPYIGTQLWIKSLNLSIVDEWRQQLIHKGILKPPHICYCKGKSAIAIQP
ncbi:serine carboxypeptidase-like 18 [Quercus lobata]|uniref:serine carboxypeptidase-like 18 n=1 Tax=Quercus lobata TaxID=97700 RepID=UPI001245E9A0|nr:serine carboxypeptidase-like 18 [Quercus lobata]